MKDKILNKLMIFIEKNNNLSDIKLKEIRYGLESIYLTTGKMIVVTIISIILNTYKELLLIYTLYSIIRLTAFGLHAKNSKDCWIASLITFVGIPLLAKYVIINNLYTIILSIIFMIIIIVYAPSETIKRPIRSYKKRKIYKIITTITCLIYITLIIVINNLYFKNIIMYSLFIEAFVINPLSYKLFGLTYINSTSYNKKKEKEVLK